MKAPDISKRLKTNKSGTNLIVVVAIATVVTVFCLVSAKTLLSQASHQKRVLDARNAALKQLESNINDANTLSQQYQVFQSGNPTNIIGGKNSTDTNLQPPDGDNARIVLDALPATYDYPALVSSVAKILNNNRFNNQSIEGTDESASIKNVSSAKPETKTITLEVQGTANYKAIQSLLRDLERSIRPFDVMKVDIKGAESNMTVVLNINTYFQPSLTLDLVYKEVK